MAALNTGMRSADYSKKLFRSGHADDLWRIKYGIRDHRGGGRASGRETISRIMAGAVARMALNVLRPSFQVMAFVRSIGALAIEENELEAAEKLFSNKKNADAFPARFPCRKKSKQAIQNLLAAKKEGESLGSSVELWMEGLPPGLGRPVFHKLKADLGKAFLSLGGSGGILIGRGGLCAAEKGGGFHRKKESYGGLRGGLSTGERIQIQIPFKPPASIGPVALKGRHDPCIGPRAAPVMEAMACLVVMDHLLSSRLDRL